jgi:hypothetical protein
MNGAHCLDCREDGPDLVLTKGQTAGLPPGAEVRIAFTCGRCRRRWTWTITAQADGGLVYAIAS